MSVEMTKTRFSLPLYSVDVMRMSNASGYLLGSGQARTGSDLVFPLAKLHRVGGQVLAKDGHVLNGGKIELLYADDQSEMTETTVEYDERAFHLEFVPEGDFLLKVADAKDLTRVQVANAPGSTPRFHEDSKTLKSHGDAEHALLVKGDTNDVLVVVPEVGKAENASP